MLRSVPGARRAQLGAVGLAAMLSLSVATSAAAGSADCLWRNLPAASRNAILSGYAKQGSEALAAADISNDLMRSMVRSCTGRGPSDDEAREAGAALVGLALAEAAAADLAGRHGISRAKLSVAWTGLSSADRATLLRQFSGAEPTPHDDAELFGVVRRVALSLGWKARIGGQPLSDPEFKTIADYVTGRAQAAAFETGF